MIRLIILFTFTGAVSAWMLYRRDAEARRLYEIEKQWKGMARDDIALYQKRRRNLIIGYTAFLLISVSAIFTLIWELMRSSREF